MSADSLNFEFQRHALILMNNTNWDEYRQLMRMVELAPELSPTTARVLDELRQKYADMEGEE